MKGEGRKDTDDGSGEIIDTQHTERKLIDHEKFPKLFLKE